MVALPIHINIFILSFKALGLIEPLLKALDQEGYTTPTPVQEQCIPPLLEGRDLLGCAQTGTGKTAAFALPLLQLMSGEQKEEHRHDHLKALILTPTRELAIQIGESFAAYGRFLKINHEVIFGGVSQHTQVAALRKRPEVLIATPGRLLDLMQQGHVRIGHIQFFVLDEADRMLDMGFIHDVRKVIAKLPAKRQTLFFSATMPGPIQHLASSLLHDPIKVEVTPPATTVDLIDQYLYFVDKNNKKDLLLHILRDHTIETALVFTRTKYGADKLTRFLLKAGIRAEAIHGDKAQNARQRALQNFKNKHTRILVATDIAARGIDIDNLTHVVNFELPNMPESYVHRIGRTGRAGALGKAISFCDYEEKIYLKDIERTIRKELQLVKDHPFDVPLLHPVSMNKIPANFVDNTRKKNIGSMGRKVFAQRR